MRSGAEAREEGRYPVRHEGNGLAVLNAVRS